MKSTAAKPIGPGRLLQIPMASPSARRASHWEMTKVSAPVLEQARTVVAVHNMAKAAPIIGNDIQVRRKRLKLQINKKKLSVPRSDCAKGSISSYVLRWPHQFSKKHEIHKKRARSCTNFPVCGLADRQNSTGEHDLACQSLKPTQYTLEVSHSMHPPPLRVWPKDWNS